MGAGIQVGEKHTAQTDRHHGNDKLDLIYKKELIEELPDHDALLSGCRLICGESIISQMSQL